MLHAGAQIPEANSRAYHDRRTALIFMINACQGSKVTIDTGDIPRSAGFVQHVSRLGTSSVLELRWPRELQDIWHGRCLQELQGVWKRSVPIMFQGGSVGRRYGEGAGRRAQKGCPTGLPEIAATRWNNAVIRRLAHMCQVNRRPLLYIVTKKRPSASKFLASYFILNQ